MSDWPRGWIMGTVGQMGEVSLGRQRAPKYHHGEGMRPYLRVANVFEDRIDTTDVMQMTFSDEEFERYRVRPGDVLLNEGQSPHLLGRPAIYRGQPPDVAFTNSLIRFRAGPAVTPEWALIVFRHYMRSRRFMRESRITTNIAHLSATRFSAVEFPVPPIAEQRRIVAAVEEQFSRLDSGVATLESVQQGLRRMAAASYSLMHETALSASQARPLIEVCEFIVDGDHNPPKRISDGVPYLTAKHVKNGRISTDDASFISQEDFTSLRRRYDPHEGDVLVTCVGTLGEVAVVPDGLIFAADRNLAAVRPGSQPLPLTSRCYMR